MIIAKVSDLFARILAKKYKIEARKTNQKVVWHMMAHSRYASGQLRGASEYNAKNDHRHALLSQAVERMDHDGLNNVEYKIMDVNFYLIFTQYLVDVGENEENPHPEWFEDYA